MSSAALLSAHVIAFHLKPVAFFAIHPLFSLPYIAPFCFQYINWRTKLSSNLKSLLSVKQVTVKNNINVGAGKDFDYYSKPPTVNGYTPIGVNGYDLVGDWDVWVNISSCYYNSSNDLLYIKGHNFGTGTCIALANVFVLYKKN